MPVSDRPMTYKEFAAIKSQLVTELQLTPRQWLEILGTNVDSTGNPQNLLSTAGAVTEASAAGISAYTQNTMSHVAYNASDPIFGEITAGTAVQKHQKRIANVLLTSDGAGAVAATAVVPALAGYTCHARLIGVWADSTDAATTFTFAIAAGTILGPAVHVVATTANSVTQFGAAAAGQTGCPVYVRGTIAADDNKALTCAVAGYAATANLWVMLEYWYET